MFRQTVPSEDSNMLKLRSTIFVQCISALFGMSSWIALNGLWVEMPILVNRLPESWKLASYLVLITQVANVGTITYSLVRRCIINKKKLEKISIHISYAFGTIALVCMVFAWQQKDIINGNEHSVAFLLLTFFLAIVDCTSSVLYTPFMSSVPSKFLVAHLIGQALSGLVPSFTALAQGVGGNPECHMINGTLTPVYPSPRFTVEVFLIFLVVMVLVSWVAFLFLSNLKRFFGIELNYEVIKSGVKHSSKQYPTWFIAVLLITEAVTCALTNGVLTSIQPYSVLIYGNVTYHFVVTFNAIASPVGCFLSAIRFKKQLPILLFTLTTAFCTATFIFLSALASPKPLIAFEFASTLIVIVWIINNLGFSYSRSVIVNLLRRQQNSNRLLFLGGVFTQIGSAVGAFVMFYVVNYTDTFVSYQACSNKTESQLLT